MVRPIAKTPLEELHETCAGLRLREVDLGPVTSLAPLGRDGAALGAVLAAQHGLSWPEAGRSLAEGPARIVWSGPEQALLMGCAPDPALAGVAALTDQSDAWAALELSGGGARDVLARLVALDLRDAAFGIGATARCQLVHMSCSLTLLEADTWLILVFRSMARSAADEIRHAMQGVAARQVATG